MIKVMVVMGTRPEAIKLVPVVKELKNRPDTSTIVVATGQHREMLDQVLGLFRIEPDYKLNLMIPNQTLFHVTGKTILGFEDVLDSADPDVILVQGDTTTSFIGGLAGFYRKIPIGHVEAGLRTGDRYSPFPEEINRRLISVLTDYHFAPTTRNRDNLINEGIPADRIIVTGNTGIDTLFMTVNQDYHHEFLSDYDYKCLILMTAHRRENFGMPMCHIFEAVAELAINNPNFLIVYPVHLNQNVQQPAHQILGKISNIRLLEPLAYYPFVNLMAKADLILTDSGGIQEEAPSLGKPVLVLRNETERPEAVEAGTVKMVGTDKERIILESERILNDEKVYQRMARAHNPYGDGKSAPRIVDFLLKHLNDF
jgi:UDP-N-acetylglucosamine 2-epimerase (non-hydrolysing)